MLRFDKLSEQSVLTEAIEVFSRSAHLVAGPPYIRMLSAEAYGNCLFIRDGLKSEALMQAYELALNILPQLSFIGTKIDLRYRQFFTRLPVACDSAATAIANDNIQKALEWLEQGRSVIWGQILQMHNPSKEMKEKHPEIAAQLEQVAYELNIADSSSL